jgi:hypothetical protein
VKIDVGKEVVLVESALTSHEVQDLIESTGRRAVLKGIGGTELGTGTLRCMNTDSIVYDVHHCPLLSVKKYNSSLLFFQMS